MANEVEELGQAIVELRAENLKLLRILKATLAGGTDCTIFTKSFALGPPATYLESHCVACNIKIDEQQLGGGPIKEYCINPKCWRHQAREVLNVQTT